MARHTDATPPAVPKYVPREGYVEETRSYELITPLLGGGAKVNSPDSETVVRVSQIRGFLRFWWRATRGAQYASVAELKAAEAAIWGGSNGTSMRASGIGLELLSVFHGNEIELDVDIYPEIPSRKAEKQKISSKDSELSYVLFPLRDKTQVRLWKNVQFSLRFRFRTDLKPDLEAALWAWEMFGGVGARTRRGLGAVMLTHIDDVSVKVLNRTDISSHLLAESNKHVYSRGALKGLPRLSSALHLGQYNSDDASVGMASVSYVSPMRAWHAAVKHYQSYRQTRHSSVGSSFPGESIWPDANALRRLAGVSERTKNQYQTVPHLPKAQLGLPIEVSFPKAKFDGFTDRVKFSITSTEDRHASPLIFRPYPVQGGYVVLLLIIGGSRIADEVIVKTQYKSIRSGKGTLPARASLDIKTPRGTPHGPTNTADVLAGVFAYMQQ